MSAIKKIKMRKNAFKHFDEEVFDKLPMMNDESFVKVRDFIISAFVAGAEYGISNKKDLENEMMLDKILTFKGFLFARNALSEFFTNMVKNSNVIDAFERMLDVDEDSIGRAFIWDMYEGSSFWEEIDKQWRVVFKEKFQ